MSNSSISSVSESLGAAPAAVAADKGQSGNESVTLGQWVRRWFWHAVVRQITLISAIAILVAGWIGRRRFARDGKLCEIMLTGRFDSNNWIMGFLGPLSASKECGRVYMVSTNPVPILPHVVAIYPPKWLVKVIGGTAARLMTFLWSAMRRRPHVVGGFHLIYNGIAAAIVGRLAGARSIYFCVGGPSEVLDGGIHAENNVYRRMETADPAIEKRLIKMVSSFDTVITMGTRAIQFFRDKGVETHFHVVSGSIDPVRFCPSQDPSLSDVILTGRLVPVKRIDVLLKAVRLVVDRLPEVSVVIVGDGPLRGELEQLSKDLGIDRHVRFTGFLEDDDVVANLRQSKIFVLTSDSEGLSLAMTEAMMCGLPAVVSNVGDLGDLVKDGVNGYLVPRRRPEVFADRLVELLVDPSKLEAFSRAARRAAMCCETQATIHRWDGIFANL